MIWEDPKKAWEIDHEWEFIGVYRPHNGNNVKTFKCKQCEAHYFDEETTDKKTLYSYPSPFRPKNSGCQILYVADSLRKYNEELKKELLEYETAFKLINKLLNRNKNEPD